MHSLKFTDVIQEAAHSDSVPEYEADTEGVLSELATAFDASCRFHVKNQDEPLPKSVEEMYGRGMDRVAIWAKPTPNPLGKNGSTDEEEGIDVTDTVDLTLESAYQHEWLAFLINYFANLGGINAMVKVRSQAGLISARTSEWYLLYSSSTSKTEISPLW